VAETIATGCSHSLAKELGVGTIWLDDPDQSFAGNFYPRAFVLFWHLLLMHAGGSMFSLDTRDLPFSWLHL
jgi:hypothetical protein